MANHPSALKRARQNERRRIRNASVRTRVRNLKKKVYHAVEAKSLSEAESALRQAVPQIQKATAKGVLHHKTARRYISRLARAVNSLQEVSS